MSQKFKKGDTLKHYTSGKLFTALCNSYFLDGTRDERLAVEDEDGVQSTMYADQFTLHTPKQSTIPEGMEPFDLEIALKEPDRVCTRDGRSVKIAGVNNDADNDCKIAGWLQGGSVFGWHINGASFSNAQDDYDLFLRAVEVKVYEAVSPNLRSMSLFTTLEAAIANSGPASAAIVELTYTGNRLTSVAIVHQFNQ